jgi:hypothetical protein
MIELARYVLEDSSCVQLPLKSAKFARSVTLMPVLHASSAFYS